MMPFLYISSCLLLMSCVCLGLLCDRYMTQNVWYILVPLLAFGMSKDYKDSQKEKPTSTIVNCGLCLMFMSKSWGHWIRATFLCSVTMTINHYKLTYISVTMMFLLLKRSGCSCCGRSTQCLTTELISRTNSAVYLICYAASVPFSIWLRHTLLFCEIYTISLTFGLCKEIQLWPAAEFGTWTTKDNKPWSEEINIHKWEETTK